MVQHVFNSYGKLTICCKSCYSDIATKKRPGKKQRQNTLKTCMIIFPNLQSWS